MTNETFDKVAAYLGLHPSDRRRPLLHSIFVLNATKSEAATAFGFSKPSVGLIVDRALRDLRRAGDLTGVYIEPVIRRGIPGRKA